MVIIKKITKINKDKLEILARNNFFQKKIETIRVKYGINRDGFSNGNEVKTWQAKVVEANKIHSFYSEIDYILRGFHLSNNFQYSILAYILYNSYFKVPAASYAINTGSKNISVTIYQKPTQAEWVDIKKQVDSFLKLAESGKYSFLKNHNYPLGNKVQKPRRNIERTLDILDKLNEGKSLEQVEAESFSKDDDFITTAQSKKNIQIIKTTKHRYKKQGYI